MRGNMSSVRVHVAAVEAEGGVSACRRGVSTCRGGCVHLRRQKGACPLHRQEFKANMNVIPPHRSERGHERVNLNPRPAVGR